MKEIVLVLILLLGASSFAQIQGKVTDVSLNELSYVNVYVEHTTKGATSNENGSYEIKLNKTGVYTIVFQYLGYKTLTKKVTVTKFPFILNIQLVEEDVSLDEVEVIAKENPATTIIKKAIANRKDCLNKLLNYKSDFYSKSLYKIKNAPKKILGQDVGDLGGGLDSTRSGIVYLSETSSKIFNQQPNTFKEQIIASKVSGDDNGFSFNTASSVNFSFYNNTVNIIEEAVSPIADFAFTYYKYKLEGVLYQDNFTINKIKVIPKRPDDRSFDGYIYIVDDSWEIYGIDLNLTGKDVFFPALDTLNLKQNFYYDENQQHWVLKSQLFNFDFKFLGIKGDGLFTAVYNNYNFSPKFDNSAFNNEVILFEKSATKKTTDFWENNRPVQLTEEEKKDYLKKDSVQTVRKSKPYLDSTDRIRNRFKLGNFVMGYTYTNSFKNFQTGIGSPINTVQFNTVQGWNSNLNLFYTKQNKEKTTWLRFNTYFAYGLSDNKVRTRVSLATKLNNFSKPTLSLSGGRELKQFNNTPVISQTINSLSSLLFEDNYAKFYDKEFIELNYHEEIWNGILLTSKVAYENRKPVFNTTNYSFINEKEDIYTANNPINQLAYNSSVINEHAVYKLAINARIRFNQKYYTYPDGKFNEYSRKYPQVTIGAETIFGSEYKKHQYGLLKTQLFQNINLKNKGRFVYNLKGGLFLNAADISFIDYKHFNGNQTHISSDNMYINRFNIMPYYQFSTNQNYFEGHVEHNFQGYILNKLPVFKKLNYFLAIGSHIAATHYNKPYTEYSVGLENLGWGKFRFFRLDYTWSTYNGNTNSGIVFGLKFLEVLNLK